MALASRASRVSSTNSEGAFRSIHSSIPFHSIHSIHSFHSIRPRDTRTRLHSSPLSIVDIFQPLTRAPRVDFPHASLVVGRGWTRAPRNTRPTEEPQENVGTGRHTTTT